MQQPPTIPLDAQGLMPLIMPLITGFLTQVSKLPPDERMRRINRVLTALRGDAP
jgi:hypothetical protein